MYTYLYAYNFVRKPESSYMCVLLALFRSIFHLPFHCFPFSINFTILYFIELGKAEKAYADFTKELDHNSLPIVGITNTISYIIYSF